MASHIFFILFIFLLASCSMRKNIIRPKGESTIIIADFSQPMDLDPVPLGWKHRTFWFIPKVDISFVTKNDVKAAKFQTNESASMLFRFTEVPLKDYPILKWTWLVEKNVESTIDESTKQGDDSAARIFVSFDVDGASTRALELIWGIKLKRGDKKFTHDFNHYVVRGHQDQLNRWYYENINLLQIYEEFWPDKKPAIVKDIAFFCDTDNTKKSSIAYFGKLTLDRI